MIAITERELRKFHKEEFTDTSSLTSTQLGDVITLYPDSSPQWQKDALIALFHVAKLPVDWDSYGSIPPLPKVVKNAERLLMAIKFEDLPVPHIVPVSGGGIQIEWSISARELELEIMPDGSVEYLEVEADKPFLEGELDASNINQIQSLILWLTHVTAGQKR